MPSFEITSNGQTFEVDAPDEQSALKAVKAVQGPVEPAPVEPAPVSGSQSTVSSSPPLPAWQRLPLMASQALVNGAIGAANFPADASNFINRYTTGILPNVLTRPISSFWNPNVSSTPETSSIPTIPPLSDPRLAPQSTPESIGVGALEGAGAVGATGLAKAGVFALQKGLPVAANLVTELGRMGREAFTYGAVPGAAAETASELTQNQSEPVRKVAALGTGAVTAILAHQVLGQGNPFESVAKTLGSSTNAETTGRVVQQSIRDWKTGTPTIDETGKSTPSPNSMPAKIEAAKAPILSALNPSVTTDYSSTVKALQERTSRGGSSQPLIDAVSPFLPKILLFRLEDMAAKGKGIFAQTQNPPSERPLGGIRTTGESPNWQPSPKSLPPGEGTIYAGGPPGPSSNPIASPASLPPPTGSEVGPHLNTINIPPPNEALPSAQTALTTRPVPSPPPPIEGTGIESKPNGFGPRQLIGVTTPVEEAMDFRTALGKLKAQPNLIQGAEQEDVDRVYRAVSTDIGRTLGEHGLGDEWQKYNATTAPMYKAIDNVFSKATAADELKNETVRPEDAAKWFWNHAKNGSTDLTALREHVPAAADELAAGFLRERPEKWASLPDASKAALVPSPWDRVVLDHATPPPLDASTRRLHTEQAGVGAFLGEIGGNVADKYFSESMLHGTSIDPHLAALIAASTPAAVRFGKNVITNPQMLRVPSLGAFAGNAITSPLTEEERKRQGQ